MYLGICRYTYTNVIANNKKEAMDLKERKERIYGKIWREEKGWGK